MCHHLRNYYGQEATEKSIRYLLRFSLAIIPSELDPLQQVRLEVKKGQNSPSGIFFANNFLTKKASDLIRKQSLFSRRDAAKYMHGDHKK